MTISNVLVLCFSFCLLQTKHVLTADLAPNEGACVRELHLEKTEIENLVNQDVVPEDNAKFNNFLGCYWQKMGWQSGDGEIEYHILKASLPELLKNKLVAERPKLQNFLQQMVWGAISDCEHSPPPKGSTNGQTAVRVQNCIMREVKSESANYLKLKHI